MTRNGTLTAFGLLATLGVSSLSPVLADGYHSRQQTDKNNARNIAVAGAAVAIYGLLSHNGAATVIGAAGAALGGSQYEKDRRQQSQDSNGRRDYRDNQNRDNQNRDNQNRDYQNRNSDRNWGNGNRNRNNSDQDTGGWRQGRGRAGDAHTGNDHRWNNTNNNRDGDRDTDDHWDGGRNHDR